ncbi:GntR family transcriptional regulator [Polaribacter sp. R77954]|uniref:GntR family transcriptional regulator n=1 Tax=Polaribacter sp. R77954 TaxID=3093870 RepID=UPI0037C8658C
MIERYSLKSQIINTIWQLILKGDIKPNEPLREIHLAKQLNISRTPLREALQKLEWQNIVKSEPGKGFRLSGFSVQEVREIYPLRAKLESYALELSGIPSDKNIQKLVHLNEQMLAATSPKLVIELDEQWHNLLIANCKNRILLDMISMLHKQSKRYEYAYMNMKNKVEVSTDQHLQIIKFLQKGNLKKAAKLFAKNNAVGIETLVSWLESKNEKNKQ